MCEIDQMKKYYEFMNEISEDELFEGLLSYGMFGEKLPPIFKAQGFFNYIDDSKSGRERECGYVTFESMRNTLTPRTFGIPNPFAYYKLCKTLSDNWFDIREHFKKYTFEQEYKTSRIHIRKLIGEKCLFKMSYKNFEDDGDPYIELRMGAKYIVHSDISSCFPSVYTHAMPWALIGRQKAKKDREQISWYNRLDYLTRLTKSGETHGILIGPHTSNLLSEIILVVVDKALYDAGYKFYRNIDDYTCFVDSYDKAEEFVIKLSEELRSFGFQINHKKTKIESLPKASVESWVRKLSNFQLIGKDGKVWCKHSRSFLDYAMELFEKNNDTAIFLYAMKVLAGQEHNANSKKHCLKTFLYLSLLYPYLIQYLDEFVFEKFGCEKEDVEEFAQKAFEINKKAHRYNALCHLLYLAVKYDFEIEIDFDEVKDSKDCILLVSTYWYYSKKNLKQKIKMVKDYAKYLLNYVTCLEDFDKLWLFFYEACKLEDLENEWKAMKRKKVTFLI